MLIRSSSRSDHGGAVHAYVADEVIVTWPVTTDPVGNARCPKCFFAIERKLARFRADYDCEFGPVPRFAQGWHSAKTAVRIGARSVHVDLRRHDELMTR